MVGWAWGCGGVASGGRLWGGSVGVWGLGGGSGLVGLGGVVVVLLFGSVFAVSFSEVSN